MLMRIASSRGPTAGNPAHAGSRDTTVTVIPQEPQDLCWQLVAHTAGALTLPQVDRRIRLRAHGPALAVVAVVCLSQGVTVRMP